MPGLSRLHNAHVLGMINVGVDVVVKTTIILANTTRLF
jgi:hypothetical protein